MTKFYSPGGTDALVYAIQLLHDSGIEFLPCPDETVTHLLLPVPSFDPDGHIKGGGSLEKLLQQLSDHVVIIGGNLDRAELAAYQTVDLLHDPEYVTQNASITAYCAIRLAATMLPITWQDLPVLVVGWGRIGKCLAQLLKQLGVQVTVAARKESDRAMLAALGYAAVDTQKIDTKDYRVIFNTAPVMVLPECPGKALKIDLASKPGIGGKDILQARGLPGKDAPESSGALIAKTVLRLIDRKD